MVKAQTGVAAGNAYLRARSTLSNFAGLPHGPRTA